MIRLVLIISNEAFRFWKKYGLKRFDREGNTKHHVQSRCGIQHYDFNDMYGYSYEQVFQTMRMLRLTYPDVEEMFRRMVFNVLATNYDDHTKNISFILKRRHMASGSSV